MRYWINRRARELSLRFMYSLEVDDIEPKVNLQDVKLDINNFWDSNPVTNYYMLKRMLISDQSMIVIGCSLLKSGKVFLRVVNLSKYNEIIEKSNNMKNFKNFLKIYNANEKNKN